MTQVDLNLLSALDVLLAEGSVTAAAQRLHLSVPATSRTLARIRRTFDDPILVRAGRGLVPTPRALALRARLHQLVEEAHALIDAGRELDLASLRRTFTIRANDSLTCLLAARLVARIQAIAPRVDLRFVPEGEEDIGPLRDGPVDLDLGNIADLGPEIRAEQLYQSYHVGLLAPGHPLGDEPNTLRRLAAVDHVSVSRRGRARGPLDDLLAEHGLSRRVVAVVPTFPIAAHMILTSELTGLFPSAYAHQLATLSGAHLFAVPGELPPVLISQAWHIRFDTDLAHQWLRAVVKDVISG